MWAEIDNSWNYALCFGWQKEVFYIKSYGTMSSGQIRRKKSFVYHWHICNVWRNMLYLICWSIGHLNKCPVGTLIMCDLHKLLYVPFQWRVPFEMREVIRKLTPSEDLAYVYILIGKACHCMDVKVSYFRVKTYLKSTGHWQWPVFLCPHHIMATGIRHYTLMHPVTAIHNSLNLKH